MHLVSAIPTKLYKYMSQEHLRNFVEDGQVLFRSLTSFRQMEHEHRGDMREGCHVDSPDNNVVIADIWSRHLATGPFSMRTGINADKVFAFCMSRTYNEEMYVSFGSDVCVVVIDPKEFIRRCQTAVKRLLLIDRVGFAAGSVGYYEFNKPAPLSIADPVNIPFLKPINFSEQNEFRLCFGKKGAFKIRRRLIANRMWETAPDHLQGMPQQKFLHVGNLSDITEIRAAESSLPPLVRPIAADQRAEQKG